MYVHAAAYHVAHKLGFPIFEESWALAIGTDPEHGKTPVFAPGEDTLDTLEYTEVYLTHMLNSAVKWN